MHRTPPLAWYFLARPHQNAHVLCRWYVTAAARRCLPVLGIVLFVGSAWAQPESKPALDARQKLIEQQYETFEAVVQRMADLLRQEDPDRAALMMKVFAQSKKTRVLQQMEQIAGKLEQGQFGEAVDLQELIVRDMDSLLELLLSENRAQELRERRERVEQYLKDLQAMKQQQQTLRLQTENSQDEQSATELSEKQKDLADRVDKLRDKIEEENETDKRKSPESEKEPKSDTLPTDQDGEKESQTPEQESKEATKPGDTEKSSDSEMPKTENLRSASEQMRDAQKQLEQLKRQKASEKQDEAIRELDQAIEKLEELLRQLREEERQQLLASLEDRFRKMHDLQQLVYEGTVRLDRIPKDKRTRVDQQQILALSRQETEIVAEAEQTLLVLQDDGTALAFPEAVLQMRDDMNLIASLLSKADTGSFTQELEQAVLEALQEMVQALQQEQQDSKKDGPPPAKSGQSSKQKALVQKLAELKMVRSLQQRVNERTVQLAEQSQKETSLGPELRQAARGLAERQLRLYEVTREIAREAKQQ